MRKSAYSFICLFSLFSLVNVFSNESIDQLNSKKEFLLFSAEIDNYVDIATQLKETPAYLNLIKECSTRISDFYFERIILNAALASDINTYIAQSIQQNEILRPEFVLLADAIVKKGQEIVLKNKKKNRKSYILNTVKGTLLNSVMLNSYFFYKVKPMIPRSKATDFIVNLGERTLSKGAAFAVGNSRPISIARDERMKAIEKFSNFYSDGESFIQDLTKLK